VKNNNDNPSVTESATAERRQFFRQATAIGVGTAISSLPLASGAQTQDSFVLATVQLSIKPGKLDALCKESIVSVSDCLSLSMLIARELL
jgi:hypothetical protein